MTNIIIAVVGVMGTVVGAVLGGLLTFYTTRKNEHDKIIREKCEGIYDLSVQIKHWIDNEIDNWWLLFDEDALIIPNPSKNLPCPTDRLLMLVNLYASSLEEKALKLTKIVDTFNSLEYYYAEAGWSAFEIKVDDYLRNERRKTSEVHAEFVASIKKLVNSH